MYANNTLNSNFGIKVPLPRGEEAPISHKSVDHAEKTLGTMTLLDGNSKTSIRLMQEKAQKWINDVQNGHLHHRNLWLSLKMQFWPQVGYGLCSSTATFAALKMALHRQYYQILPLGGVVQTTSVMSRTIDAGFYGVGLPHFRIEALIAMTNKLLMHYGCKTATKQFMHISHSLLFVELGMSFQPLQEDYEKLGYLVTHSWMKMPWEKLSLFDMKIIIPDTLLKFPREGDQFIMQVLFQAGYGADALRRLNRVRVSMQLVFMSDILTASGNRISLEVLSHHPRGEAWSNMRWPNEQPTTFDIDLWKNAMLSICPSQCSITGIGQFIGQTHRVWRWHWNNDTSTLHRTNNDSITEDVFVAGRKLNHFHYSHSQHRKYLSTVCLVQPTLEGEHWHIFSTAPTAEDDPDPTTFLEVLELWGNTWLWDNMSVLGRMEWIVGQSILDGSLVAVTDGSYIRELYPHLCSAAFVLECSKGQGRVIGSFSESLAVANAYQEDFLGFMAIHLVLLSMNKIHPTLGGSVEIILDCLGTLNQVSYLPPYQIPSRCQHSNILKNILVHCRELSFVTYYSHIKVHQDNNMSFNQLSRKVQLNCICNHATKYHIAKDGIEKLEPGKMFPLEPIGVFVQRKKDDV
jgi:hypothetical protein